MNILKSNSGKKGLVGVCNCGYKKEFQPLKDYKIPFDDQLQGFEFIDTFLCPKCNKEYHLLGEFKVSMQSKIFPYVFFVSIVILLILISTSLISNILNEQQKEKESFYKTGDPSDMTNKELIEFLEWQEKVNKKEFENSKVFK